MNINLQRLVMVKEKATRYELSVSLNRPSEVAEMLQTVTQMQDAPEEQFWMVCLDTKNKIAGLHLVAQGNLNSAIVHPREVFKRALLNNASSIILAHNHPSGNPEPSQQDVDLTNRLAQVGDLVGITVLDHIVLGDAGCYLSLKERNMM